MKTHNIPLESFIPKGKVSINVDNGELHMSANTRVTTCGPGKINHYAYLENKFKLPFRVDITVKIDSPDFHLIIGKGQITFGNGTHRNPTDILGGETKPGTYSFDNYIPLNEYVYIRILQKTPNLMDCHSAKNLFLSNTPQKLNDEKRRLYEKFILNKKTVNDYTTTKTSPDGKLSRLMQIFDVLLTATSKVISIKSTDDKRKKIAERVSAEHKLKKPFVDLLVDKIYLYPDNHIEIVWKVAGFDK